MKRLIIKILLTIPVIIIFYIMLANLKEKGIKIGIEKQKQDNIKHGVMDSNGKWLPCFRLAEEKKK